MAGRSKWLGGVSGWEEAESLYIIEVIGVYVRVTYPPVIYGLANRGHRLLHFSARSGKTFI